MYQTTTDLERREKRERQENQNPRTNQAWFQEKTAVCNKEGERLWRRSRVQGEEGRREAVNHPVMS